MSAPAWPQERLDRWDASSRRWLRIGAILLLVSSLLPLPWFDSSGVLHIDWWFTSSASDVATQSYGLPDRTPRTLLFVALGVWVTRCASLRPLARRGRAVTLASLALTLFLTTRSSWGEPWPGLTDGYPGVLLGGWQAVALPALGLLLVSQGAARRWGRALCALAGGLMAAYELVPDRWSLAGHLDWVSTSLAQGLPGRLWMASALLTFGAGLMLLVMGLARPPRRWVDFLAPRLWAAGVLSGLVAGLAYALWRGDPGEPRGTDMLCRLITYPILAAREYGHYLITVVGVFLWISTARRPAPEPMPPQA